MGDEIVIPKLLVFDIILPSTENFLDYMFCVETIVAGHPWSGGVLMVPSLIILLFNAYKWITTKVLSEFENIMIFLIPFLSPYLHGKLFLSWFTEPDESKWKKNTTI